MRNRVFCAVLLVLCVSVRVTPGQALSDAGRPKVIRKTDVFSFDGGTLPGFMAAIQREFGLDPDHFRPIPGRLQRSILVQRIEVKATNHLEVLQRYNQLSDKDPRMGRWLLPGLTPGIPAEAQIGFVRDAVRQNGRFEFEGGSLYDLIVAIDLQFGVDLNEVASIPNSIDQIAIQVPKMRLRSDDYTDVLELYNEISRETDHSTDHSLGRWIVKKKNDEVASVVLVPPAGSLSENRITTRAFALTVSDRDAINHLRETIDKQAAVVADMRRSPNRPQGNLAYHESTGILIVTGSPEYVELAAEIIGASQGKIGPRTEASPVKKF